MKCHDKKNTRYRSCPNSINSRCRLSSDCRKEKPTGVSPHRCRKTVISRTDTSGQEICCLIFKGRKLSETCDLLHRAPGNTIPPRPHIRKKPKLDKKDAQKAVGKNTEYAKASSSSSRIRFCGLRTKKRRPTLTEMPASS